MLARLGGPLNYDGRCFWVGSNTSRTDIIWPYGYSAAFHPPRIVDNKGRVVGRVGQFVDLGGGYVAAPRVSYWVGHVASPARRCLPPVCDDRSLCPVGVPGLWVM